MVTYPAVVVVTENMGSTTAANRTHHCPSEMGESVMELLVVARKNWTVCTVRDSEFDADMICGWHGPATQLDGHMFDTHRYRGNDYEQCGDKWPLVIVLKRVVHTDELKGYWKRPLCLVCGAPADVECPHHRLTF